MITEISRALNENIEKIVIKWDSQVVVQQIKGDFTVKELSLARYRIVVQQLLSRFVHYQIEHMLRTQNQYAVH